MIALLFPIQIAAMFCEKRERRLHLIIWLLLEANKYNKEHVHVGMCCRMTCCYLVMKMMCAENNEYQLLF